MNFSFSRMNTMKRYIISAFFITAVIGVLVSCSKELSIEKGGETVASVGSLKDSLGECLPSVVRGTFYNGVTPGSDTCFVELQVDVETAGSYTIKTDLQNGFMFADSGFFNSTGINTILLKPIGTPILQKPTVFTVTYDTSVCNFIVDVRDSTGTGLGGGGGTGTDTAYLSDTAWKFSAVNGSFLNEFNGYIDSAQIITSDGFQYLVIDGYTAATGDSAIVLVAYLPTGTIVPGDYTTMTGSAFYFYDLTTTPETLLYSADFSTQRTNITITITSYDPASKIVKGIFSGNAFDDASTTIPISSGAFVAKVI